MLRVALVVASLVAMLIPALAASPSAFAQCSGAPGSVVQLTGTPHLFIVDEQGVLHWGGDTRALAGRTIQWSDTCELGLAALQQTNRGDPWLSSGLPAIGEPIYLSKWEDNEASPTLRHIQSITDLELFGINAGNYTNFVLDRATYETRFGFPVGTLRVGPLASSAAFAWSAQQRADYDTLLGQMTTAESQALLNATTARIDPSSSLPGIATCERQGLTDFERNFNGASALQITQSCLLQGSAPPPPPPPAGVPPTPADVQALATSGAQIVISWVDTPNEVSYLVRGGPQGTQATLLSTLPANTTTFTHAGLTPSTVYCYTVSAANQAGESPPSGSICATTFGANVPSAPSSLTVVPVDPTRIQLTWIDTSTNEDGFRVLRGNAGDLIATLPPGSNSFTDIALQPGIQNCYRVVAFNGSGEASSNTVCAATTPPGAPSAPTGLLITPVAGTTTVTLQWVDTSLNEDGFRILRGAGGDLLATLPANSKAYTDTTLPIGAPACYRIVAFNSVGEASGTMVCATDRSAVGP